MKLINFFIAIQGSYSVFEFVLSDSCASWRCCICINTLTAYFLCHFLDSALLWIAGYQKAASHFYLDFDFSQVSFYLQNGKLEPQSQLIMNQLFFFFLRIAKKQIYGNIFFPDYVVIDKLFMLSFIIMPRYQWGMGSHRCKAVSKNVSECFHWSDHNIIAKVDTKWRMKREQMFSGAQQTWEVSIQRGYWEAVTSSGNYCTMQWSAYL